MAHIYILLIYQPGSRTDIRWRRVSERPWSGIHRGRSLEIRGRRLRIVRVRRTTNSRQGCVAHVVHAYTRPELPSNVVPMPASRSSVTADFLRFQVLVRVFDGNPDRWLEHLRRQGDSEEDDIRFVRWIRGRLRREPALLDDIRRMVDRTPLWCGSAL